MPARGRRLEVERAAFWQGEAVCLATDMARHGLNENPALYALRGGEAVRLFSRDEAPGSNVAADARYGGGYGVRFEGGHLYYTNAHHTGHAASAREEGRLRRGARGRRGLDRLL